MKVLLIESDAAAGDDSAELLECAGHTVVRCHLKGAVPFPCVALDGGPCPLESNVDVALAVRAHPYPRPTPLEDGIPCAIRHHVPLVIAGHASLNPFRRWTERTADHRDVVAGCEAAANAPLSLHGEIATAEARRVSLDPDATAVVRRRNGTITATVTLSSPVDRSVRDLIGVRIAGALRTVDRASGAIDVEVTTTEGADAPCA